MCWNSIEWGWAGRGREIGDVRSVLDLGLEHRGLPLWVGNIVSHCLCLLLELHDPSILLQSCGRANWSWVETTNLVSFLLRREAPDTHLVLQLPG